MSTWCAGRGPLGKGRTQHHATPCSWSQVGNCVFVVLSAFLLITPSSCVLVQARGLVRHGELVAALLAQWSPASSPAYGIEQHSCLGIPVPQSTSPQHMSAGAVANGPPCYAPFLCTHSPNPNDQVTAHQGVPHRFMWPQSLWAARPPCLVPSVSTPGPWRASVTACTPRWVVMSLCLSSITYYCSSCSARAAAAGWPCSKLHYSRAFQECVLHFPAYYMQPCGAFFAHSYTSM